MTFSDDHFKKMQELKNLLLQFSAKLNELKSLQEKINDINIDFEVCGFCGGKPQIQVSKGISVLAFIFDKELNKVDSFLIPEYGFELNGVYVFQMGKDDFVERIQSI